MNTDQITPLWNDNPSETDLLGFDAVVAPVVDAIAADHLDPLTVGIHARWGGGKSTVLRLLCTELEDQTKVVVVETSPWEYDDHDDVKGTLIAEVLGELQNHFKDDAALKTKVGELLGRISWSRVGKVVAKGVVMQSVDLKELKTALTPMPREEPDSMSGFKKAFQELVESLPDTKRVVVLVDDLDRCSPSAVMATLEAIKLFLSVPGMVFVLAADQDMVRDAISMNLGGSTESSRFAERYLDKIVQLPISLPVLPVNDAESYLGLLLAHFELTEDQHGELLQHVQARRLEGKASLLAEMDELPKQPSDYVLRLASQLAHGLRSDKVVNPREIKRFLNAFQVRRRMAQVRGVEVKPDVLAKLLLLEDRYRTDFQTLVNTPDVTRKDLLQAWSKWAVGDSDQRPDGVSEESKDWAAAPPELSTESIGHYLTLAATLATTRQVGVGLDAELAALLDDLMGESEVLRREAVKALLSRSEEDQRIAVENLFAATRRTDEPETAITSLVEVAEGAPSLAQDIAAGIKENCWTKVTISNAVEISQSPSGALGALARELADDKTIDAAVAQAARNVLDGDEG